MRAEGLVDWDEEFDSKAIAAAAHGVQFPSEGPLKFDRFSGEDATVRRKLEELGFTVTGRDRPAAFSALPVLAWRY